MDKNCKKMISVGLCVNISLGKELIVTKQDPIVGSRPIRGEVPIYRWQINILDFIKFAIRVFFFHLICGVLLLIVRT